MQQPITLSDFSPQKFPLKKFLQFFPRKTCSENISYSFPKKDFLIFQETELSNFFNFLSLRLKKFRRELSGLWQKLLYFQKWNMLAQSLKNSDIFSKNVFLMFQEGTCKALKSKVFVLSCNSGWLLIKA